MTKGKIVLLFFLLASAVFVVVTPGVLGAQSLNKPNVTLPSGWQLDKQTPYPGIVGDHDLQGAGLVEYTNPTTYDIVMIYYERSTTTYSNNDLVAEAEAVYQRDIGTAFTDSGIATFAGVPSGYVRVYNQTLDTYSLQLIFVKSSYYLDVFADYASTSQENVYSLINSISIPAQSTSNAYNFWNWLPYIVIAVVVVLLLIIAIVAVRRRKQLPPPPPPP
jgi:hypothetical protein